jgi:hypothetical protein
MCVTAMWLMARKRVGSWVYWIVVDVMDSGGKRCLTRSDHEVGRRQIGGRISLNRSW